MEDLQGVHAVRLGMMNKHIVSSWAFKVQYSGSGSEICLCVGDGKLTLHGATEGMSPSDMTISEENNARWKLRHEERLRLLLPKSLAMRLCTSKLKTKVFGFTSAGNSDDYQLTQGCTIKESSWSRVDRG